VYSKWNTAMSGLTSWHRVGIKWQYEIWK
jgi:hypothetical protein